MKNKNLSIFLYAQVLSSFGYNLLDSTITFHVLDLTGSVTKFSTTLIAGLLSKAIFYQISGLIADTFNKRKAFYSIDLGYALISFTIIIFILTNNLNYWIFFLASFLINAIRAISQPITKTIVPAIVHESKLVHANSYEVSNDKLARILGPVVALAILSILGFNVAIFSCFCIYTLTAYLKAQINISHISSAHSNWNMVVQRFIGGFKISFSNRRVLILLVNAILTQIFVHSFLYTVLPSILHGLGDKDIDNILRSLWFLSPKRESIWKGLQAWLRIGGVLGVLLSIFSVPKINVKEQKGISLGIYGIAFSSIVMGMLVFYLKFYELNISGFINLMFLANILLFLSMNIFTIFFSVFYQKIFDRTELGRFIANFLFLFAIASSLGTYIYSKLAILGWQYPVIFLISGAILKIALHLVYIRVKEINE